MDTFKPIADIAMRKVNRVAPQEIRMAFQDGIPTGANFVNGALIVVGALETLVDLKDHNPEAGMKVIKSGKQILEYLFPESKILLCSIENLCTFSKSVDEIMSKEEMSDEEIGKALLSTIKNAIESWIKISKKPKAADELLKLKEAKEEITKIIDSDQFDKDAAKNCIKKLTKLFFSNVGILIDGTTLPKRCLVLAKKLGVEKLFENYSQTDIDADGQINYGVPGSESNKDDVDKQNTVSDTKKQEQKSDSDQSEQVKATDPVTKKQEQKSDSDQSEQVKVNICKTIRNDFKQAEGFQVNEERGSYELQEMYNDLTLPEIEERIKKSLSCLLEAEKEHKGIFPTYSQINVDIDGHEILGIWEA